jgi:hypothetical protein
MKNNVRYTDPNVKKVCNALSEHAVFLKSMMSARKVFQPQFAQGSQMTPTGVYKAINNAQNKIIARLDKKNKGIII